MDRRTLQPCDCQFADPITQQGDHLTREKGEVYCLICGGIPIVQSENEGAMLSMMLEYNSHNRAMQQALGSPPPEHW